MGVDANPHHYTNMNLIFAQQILSGSSFVSPALGGVGQGRLNINNFPPKKIWAKPKQAGKKKKGCGENEFLPACSARRRRAVGWEAARPCVSKEVKPAKIDSLIEIIFCARPLKNVSIFAGFVRRQTASRWAGLPPCGRQLVGVLPEMSSNFFQQTPPKTISRLARCFAPRFGGQFGKIIPRFFEQNGKSPRRETAVHKQGLYCGEAARVDGFSFAYGEIQNEILLNCRCKALPFSKIKNF